MMKLLKVLKVNRIAELNNSWVNMLINHVLLKTIFSCDLWPIKSWVVLYKNVLKKIYLRISVYIVSLTLPGKNRGKYHTQEDRPRSAMSLILTLRINWRVNQSNGIINTLFCSSLSKVQNQSINDENFRFISENFNKWYGPKI